jgi:hypothetical protein
LIDTFALVELLGQKKAKPLDVLRVRPKVALLVELLELLLVL